MRDVTAFPHQTRQSRCPWARDASALLFRLRSLSLFRFFSLRGRRGSWTASGKRVRTWSGSTTSASTAGSPRSSWRGTAAATRAPRASGSTSAACRRPSRRRTSPSTAWTSWAPTRTNPRADDPPHSWQTPHYPENDAKCLAVGAAECACAVAQSCRWTQLAHVRGSSKPMKNCLFLKLLVFNV